MKKFDFSVPAANNAILTVNASQAFKETSFSKATMVMRFPAKKNAGCPKAPRDFPPRKDGILLPSLDCLGIPLPLPQSRYVCADGRTLTSQPQFLPSIGYQIFLVTHGAPLATFRFTYTPVTVAVAVS